MSQQSNRSMNAQQLNSILDNMFSNQHPNTPQVEPPTPPQIIPDIPPAYQPDKTDRESGDRRVEPAKK